MPRPPVVVVGLDCPTGLQSARVFAARGLEVIGLAGDTSHPCARTRSCRRVVRSDPDGSVATLLELGAELGERPVLLPCTDRAVLDIARHRTELSPLYRMALPSADVIELLLDKVRFAAFAAAHAFPIPRTYMITNLDEATAAAAEIGYPSILKPSIKSTAWRTHASAKALWVESPDALVRLYEQHAPWANAFVFQEWIAGGDTDHYTCDCYVNSRGEALATFCSRKIRQWPPGVGQGCMSVEHKDDLVRDTTLAVLREAGHHGQGYLEMKRDVRSGRLLIVEANVGRPTGRAAAAEKAGVELLMTMYCDVVGEPLPAERVQTFRGTKWIHERRDLQACAHLLLRRQARVRDIVRSWRGPIAFAHFSLRDPVPLLADWGKAVLATLRGRRLGDQLSVEARSGAPSLPLDGARGVVPIADHPGAVLRMDGAEVVDLDVHGILGIRALDARPDDLAAVVRELGPTATATAHAREPDIAVRFVDDLRSSRIERIGNGMASGDGGVYMLGGDREPLAHVTLGEPRSAALVVCRRGLRRVPFLSTAIDLAALSRGWIPLHASGWIIRGVGVLAAGYGGSGKTGALLAACQHGATPLADDRILMSRDGSSMVGLGQSMSLREWHVAQLSLPAAGVGWVRRTFARAATLLDGFAEPRRPAAREGRRTWMGSAKRMLGRARRRFTVQLSLEHLGRTPGAKASPDVMILLETHGVPKVVAERIAPEAAADRLAAGVADELGSVLRASRALSERSGGRDWDSVRQAAEAATTLLQQATRGKPCYVVRHPKGYDLEELHGAIEALLPAALPVADGDGAWAANGRLSGEPATST